MNSMIKGTRDGITVSMGEEASVEFESLLDTLRQELTTKAAFLRGGNVTLDATGRPLREEQIGHIRAALIEHDLHLKAVITDDDATAEEAREMDLRVAAPASLREPAEPLPGATSASGGIARASSPLEGSRGILVKHVVRSGKMVRHHGHVVLIGDVNPGGEIVAGGDIIVWGCLRGIAHAGSSGNQSAVICALEMKPLQLRIADTVARPDEQVQQGKGPEMARISADRIVVEPWSGRS